MLTLAIHSSCHDSSAALFDEYHLLAASQKERLTREKGAGGEPLACVQEVLSIGGADITDIDHVAISRSLIPQHIAPRYSTDGFLSSFEKITLRDLCVDMSTLKKSKENAIIFPQTLASQYGLGDHVDISFFNHHDAHAIPAYFYTDWDRSLAVTADSSGDNTNYSHRHFTPTSMAPLFDCKAVTSNGRLIGGIGRAYMYSTEAIGFKPRRHEGKLTGLAAYGTPTLLRDFKKHFSVDPTGLIHTTFRSFEEMRKYILDSAISQNREDVARSIQDLTEDLLLSSVKILLERSKSRKLGLAGGVFSNVKLNQRLVENTDIDEIFIFPPMGNEGLVIGGGLQALLRRDGYEAWRNKRHRLQTVYWGGGVTDIEDEKLDRFANVIQVQGDPALTAAKKLAEGEIIAIFHGKMEYGPRALGARSILASPIDKNINETLNKRLQRTEFMPFAPVTHEEDARDIFKITDANQYACRFMTITCDVRDEWIDKIPAVVHIDKTARPQVIRRRDNALYYDILAHFKKITGIPVLINTSFNTHEEPIINTPREAVRALLDTRVDYVVTSTGLYASAL